MRYIVFIKFLKATKYLDKDCILIYFYNKNLDIITENKSFILFLGRIFVSLIVPLDIFKDSFFTYKLDDSARYQKFNFILLSIFIPIRLINILEYFLCNNIYFSGRAQRFFRNYNLRITLLFSFKSLIRVYPKTFICSVMVINTCINSFIVFVWERVGSTVPNEGFDNFGFCLWFVFLAMTRLGYGDAIPISIFGRMFSTYITMTGVIILSLFTLVTGELFIFKPTEETCFNNLELIRHKDILNKKITLLMNKTLHMFNNLMLKYKKRRNNFKNDYEICKNFFIYFIFSN